MSDACKKIKSQGGYELVYRINNVKLEEPYREVRCKSSPHLIEEFVTKGYCKIPNLFTAEELENMRIAVDAVASEERAYQDPNKPDTSTSSGQYLRLLMDKSSAFACLYECQEARMLAKALLGPQVQFENVDARIAQANTPGQVVPWHIHMRVVPNPLPPFFCYPHALHILLYLDDVTEAEGAFVALPGSHKDHELHMSAYETKDMPNQELIFPKAGDCLLTHSNLWHRTLPASPVCGKRRLILFGYSPAWLRTEQRGGVPGKDNFFKEKLAVTQDPAEREILGEFFWC